MKWLAFFILFWLPLSCPAQRAPLVIILLPGTTLADWRDADAPNLHHLMASGALAVMNTRTARIAHDSHRETPESACLTLGAGSRAAADAADIQFQYGVAASALYLRRMGKPAPAGRMLDVAWPLLLAHNRGRGYAIQPGNLADALELAGVPIAAGGGQYAFVLAMDSSGTVPETWGQTGICRACLLLDAGNNIALANSVVGGLMPYAGRIIILSPFASDAAYKRGERLTPVLEWGAGIRQGLLYSPSTRRPGLVANTDFAPTAADYFHASLPSAPFGHVWQVQPSTDALAVVTRLEAESYAQDRGMRILPYLAIVLAFWILVGTALLLRHIMPRWWTLPPLLLLLALLLSASLLSFVTCFSVLSLAAWIYYRWNTSMETVPLVVIAALIIGDLALGSHWMAHSLLGYSATEGARYYGIGNEAMGVLIGVLLVLSAGEWQRGKKWQRHVITASLILVAALLGSPAAGAKAGGLLVALITFGTLLFHLTGAGLKRRYLAGLAVIVVFAMSFVALNDARHQPGHRSHIGEAASRIQQGGFSEAADIIVRKASVEFFLMTHSAWAILLWIGLASLLVLGYKRPSALYTSGLVCIAACLALNDAGVVAGALCLIPLWCAAAQTAQKGLPWNETISSRAGHSGSHAHSVTE